MKIKINLRTLFLILLIAMILIIGMGILLTNRNKNQNNELNKLNSYLLIENKKINPDNIYAFACKRECLGNKGSMLVAIAKDNSEIPIIKFSDDDYFGSFEYYDNKLYFYEFSENAFHGFYMIDFSKKAKLQQIYSVSDNLPYLDDLQYYNGKLYYTANASLYSLDIKSKDIQFIDEINNYLFYINKKTGILYYTSSDKCLYEFNLNTNGKNLIHKDAAPDYLAEDKLIFGNISEFYEYDFINKTTKKITDSWGGAVGQINIARYNGYYLYINDEFQLIKQYDDGKTEKIITDHYITSILFLPNDKLLIQEHVDNEEIHSNFIYDLNNKTITETDGNFEYSFEKIV